MPEAHLVCPHCGSTLTFGTSITAGAAVECLICMQPFVPESSTAEPAACPAIAVPALPTAKPGPHSSIPVGLPANAKPSPIASAEDDAPRPAPSRPPVRSRERSRPSGTTGIAIALGAVAVGVLVLAGSAVGFVVWKSSRTTTPGETPLAVAPNAELPSPPQSPAKPIANLPGVNPPVAKIEDEDELRRLKEIEKKQLVRKTPGQVATGPEFEWDREFTINNANVRDAYAGLSQQKINEAIAKGVAFLRQNQNQNGTWASGHSVGHAAIGGLTLLECHVPGTDAAVQLAAAHVRGKIQNLTSTYELSLAILFLDRLGDPRDRPLIQGMALRLLAGQNDCGGWTYNCPLLTPQEMFQLYSFLQSHKKPDLFNPLPAEPRKPNTDVFAMPFSGPLNLSDPFQKFNELVLNSPIETKPGGTMPSPIGEPTPMPTPAQPLPTPGQPLPKPAVPKKGAGKAPPPFANVTPPKGITPPLRPEFLNPNLRGLPVVKNQGKGKGQQMVRAGSGDNSNTQFAILAIWAARRHNVPTDQALLSAFQRFETTQNDDGGWGYHFIGRSSTNTMTCVGLLGEAMGHGTNPEVVRFDPKDPSKTIVKPALQDPRIQSGLKKLAQYIGQPLLQGDPGTLPMQNLYFLWSVERVAMIYDVKTIDGKEWYPWGAQILVHRQRPAGDWADSHYPGANPSLNTCFALLFLKRSNLVPDLTHNLRLYTGIRNPER